MRDEGGGGGEAQEERRHGLLRGGRQVAGGGDGTQFTGAGGTAAGVGGAAARLRLGLRTSQFFVRAAAGTLQQLVRVPCLSSCHMCAFSTSPHPLCFPFHRFAKSRCCAPLATRGKPVLPDGGLPGARLRSCRQARRCAHDVAVGYYSNPHVRQALGCRPGLAVHPPLSLVLSAASQGMHTRVRPGSRVRAAGRFGARCVEATWRGWRRWGGWRRGDGHAARAAEAGHGRELLKRALGCRPAARTEQLGTQGRRGGEGEGGWGGRRRMGP